MALTKRQRIVNVLLFLIGCALAYAFVLVGSERGKWLVIVLVSILATAMENNDVPIPVLRPRKKRPLQLRERDPAPRIFDDPFRAPPQAPPIAVRRPPTAPLATPIAHDETAPKPKVLG